MTQSEFKAWFDAFSEGIDGRPTEKQWDRIKERVGQISGDPLTERIFLDRYVYPAYPVPAYRPSPTWWTGTPPVTCASLSVRPNPAVALSFNGEAAMLSLGRAEAHAV